MYPFDHAFLRVPCPRCGYEVMVGAVKHPPAVPPESGAVRQPGMDFDVPASYVAGAER